MMQGGERTPTLEEAGLPEFRGATLYLASKATSNAAKADDKDKEMFVDIVDLSRSNEKAELEKDAEPQSRNETRKRSVHQPQSPSADSGRKWVKFFFKFYYY